MRRKNEMIKHLQDYLLGGNLNKSRKIGGIITLA